MAGQRISPAVRYSFFVEDLLCDALVFRPVPPGEGIGGPSLRLPEKIIVVEVADGEFGAITTGLAAEALTADEASAALELARLPDELRDELVGAISAPSPADWDATLERQHQLDRMAVVAVKIIDKAQRQLLNVEPLTELRFRLTDRAKAALALSWEAMTKRGQFPLPPRGQERFDELNKMPCGALHFVSASDLDRGYHYTIGIAQSPEAQALGTTDLTFGLDGELIVPGQAVSPIPPFLAFSSRLFAASIPTSSNISEEEQSIPLRNFPHPTAIDDLEPQRGGRIKPPVRPRHRDEAIGDLRQQLHRYFREIKRKQGERHIYAKLEATPETPLPEVGAAFDVTGMTQREIVMFLAPVLSEPELNDHRPYIALYLDVESTGDRVKTICEVVDAARELKTRYVAVADQVEDAWLPNLLEYLDPDELNAVADYADQYGVIVIDGRPVDPVYTAATAAQRIQSVFTTLSVDVLKMGMWLSLDALSARKVWQEIRSNPHIPSRMLLMPIGIVEPWCAFVDNRDANKTARAVLEPFEKIKFMIEEAEALGMPSLLTDTRHKETWVLLGRKTPSDEPHPREIFVTDPDTGEILAHARNSAIPLLSWEQFMQCERLARKAGILLGQAGSIEISQAFRVISETTYDAALDGKNPATAIWTAETERVLRTSAGGQAGDLHGQRSSGVAPFLAIVNRGYESHAKLDGWLRFLNEKGMGDEKLRTDLHNHRARLSELLTGCLNARAQDSQRYQARWDAFRRDYITYHNLIKTNFDAVRQQVNKAWRA